MKLSRQMRSTLDQLPDEGERPMLYSSSLDPLVRRGLVTYEIRAVPVTLWKPVARLTELGRQVKYQNSDD